jgi:hypothetical protein
MGEIRRLFQIEWSGKCKSVSYVRSEEEESSRNRSEMKKLVNRKLCVIFFFSQFCRGNERSSLNQKTVVFNRDPERKV